MPLLKATGGVSVLGVCGCNGADARAHLPERELPQQGAAAVNLAACTAGDAAAATVAGVGPPQAERPGLQLCQRHLYLGRDGLLQTRWV